MTAARIATAVVFAALAVAFFTQDPIEARHRPWTGPHVSEDGWYYYYYLRSAALDGDLDLDNEYRDIGNWYGFGRTSTGRSYNPFGIGPALFWAPGFLVGHAVARLSGGAPADGMTRAEQTGALTTSFLAAAAAFWIAYTIARRYTSVFAAWLGTALAFFGGPVVWYATYSPSMPHALESLGGAAFVAELLPFRERTRWGAVRLGAIGGAMALVRPQVVTLFVLLVAWDAALSWRRSGGAGFLQRCLWVCVAALLVLSPQLVVWRQQFGSFVVVPQGSGFLRIDAPLWSETLFSSRNGLFTTTPLLWFVIPGLVVTCRRDAAVGWALTVAMFLQALVNGAAWDWWGGGAFGGRRFAVTFVVWALALSLLLGRLLSSRRFAGLAAAGAFVVIVPLLVLQWRMIAAHHDRRISWESTVPFDERVRVATGWSVPGYASVGSPFAFPANALFAVRRHVPLARYDRAIGPYLLDERLPATIPIRPSKRGDVIRLTDPGAAAFVGRGFVQGRDGAVLRERVGELFVPLNRPGSLDIDVDATGPPGQAWTFNGHPVSVPRFHVEAAWVVRGLNVVHVEGDSLTIRQLMLTEGPDWPPRSQ